MTRRLAGKNVLITAAGQGIGRATAVAYVREGAQVLATDINQEALATLKAEQPAVRVQYLDVMDPGAVHALAASAPVDVLVHCAGIVQSGTILDTDQDSWDFAWRLNVTSAYEITKAFVPQMRDRASGSIVIIGSIASSIVGVPNRFAYGVTKAALIGLVKSIAVDFVGDGVRCNIICPGTVQTPSLEDRINSFPDVQKARAEFIARQPMGRLGTAEEIAATAVHLGADESAYTTGQTFVLDGGWTAA